MVIDITGFGWSGAGAVHDLLREYDDVQFAAYDFDWEFTLLWSVDGIYDLEHKLCYKHCRFVDSNAAIKRFMRLVKALEKSKDLNYDKVFKGDFSNLCHKYIEDLVLVKFEGKTLHESIFKSRFFRYVENYNTVIKKLLGNHIVRDYLKADLSRPFLISEKNTIYVSYAPESFIERTRKLMGVLFTYVRKKQDIPIVTDQMFPPDCPDLFFKYINEPIKCIIVRRDPRDIYLLAKVAYRSEIPIPVANVDDFIAFYKTTIEETRKEDSDIILNVNFEDLVYKYEETKLKIESFLGVSSHLNSLKYFNPSISINNTQLFRKYKEFNQDIKKIERGLPNSLYNFEGVDDSQKMTSSTRRVF